MCGASSYTHVKIGQLKQNTIDRINVFEMWFYRRLLGISWASNTTNDTVLNRMGHELQLLAAVERRKFVYLGALQRGPRYTLLKTRLILNGNIKGNWTGRKQVSWFRDLRQWSDLTAEALLYSVQAREKYEDIIQMGVVDA